MEVSTDGYIDPALFIELVEKEGCTGDFLAVLEYGVLTLKINTGSSVLVQQDNHFWGVHGATSSPGHDG